MWLLKPFKFLLWDAPKAGLGFVFAPWSRPGGLIGKGVETALRGSVVAGGAGAVVGAGEDLIDGKPLSLQNTGAHLKDGVGTAVDGVKEVVKGVVEGPKKPTKLELLDQKIAAENDAAKRKELEDQRQQLIEQQQSRQSQSGGQPENDGEDGEPGWWNMLSGFFTDKDGNFSITAGAKNLVAFANASNIPWLKAIVNPIADFCMEHPDLVKGTFGVLGGLGLFGRAMSALSNPALLKNPGFLTKTAIYASMVKASTEGYDAPRPDAGNRYQQQNISYQGNSGQGLNQDATSTAAFRNASGPAANGAAPVYAYGTAAPGNNGQSLADDFNNKGGSPVVTNIVPPVTTIPDYEKTPKNWLTYDIGGTGS